MGEGGVVGGRGRRRAILRVERRDQDSLAARRDQRVDPLGDGGPAVAHRMVDDRPPAPNAPSSALAWRAVIDGERRALLGPDLAVGVGGFARPGGEDDAAQDRLPDELRDLDHPAVGEEFLQIAPDRPGVGGVGRAEIDRCRTPILPVTGGSRSAIGRVRTRWPVSEK